MKVWMRRRGGRRERRAGALDVGRAGSAPAPAIDRPLHLASRSCRTASASASDAIGKPGLDDVHAERVELPRQRAASRRSRIEKPGACSPSRRVVSKIVRRLVDMSPPLISCTRAASLRQIYNFYFISELLMMAAMQLQDLNAFLAVATERSFSRGRQELHRTQPAVSQAIRRLEDELGEQLFDRSSKNGTLTEAGRLLQDYAQRLLRLAEEAEAAVRELRRSRRGRVLIGANEAAVHTLLPLSRASRASTRRRASTSGACRRARSPTEVLERSLDFGVLTFQPPDKGLQSISLGSDELVLLAHPDASASRRRSGSRWRTSGARPVVAHNDPSPARERVLRLFEQRHAPINIQIALPSLDGIKRAVEMGLGRRAAAAPLRAHARSARGQLVAVKVPELSSPRQVRLVFRQGGDCRTRRTRSSRSARQQEPAEFRKAGLHRTRDEDQDCSVPAIAAHSCPAARDVRQPRRDRLDLLESIEQQRRSRPTCRRGTLRARAGGSVTVERHAASA